MLDKKITRHGPKLRVPLQKRGHALQRFLPLRHVRRPRGHANVVLADSGVVNLRQQNARFIPDFPNGHRLVGVDPSRAHLAIHTDDAGNALRIVNLRNHIHNLPNDIPHATGEVVHVMVRARIGLLLTRHDGPPRALVALRA